ncbi:MAG TPA: hypothetical protein VFY84_09425, partial [Jiangellales bacterium]|nr:hypothetical protein [Jiangellales bacterium]
MSKREDYEQLDLTPWCTGKLDDVVGAPAPVGLRHFHGIPFRIGDRAGQTETPFVLLDADADPIRIPLGIGARHVIVAHRLLSGDRDIADGTGRTVARYLFHLTDGTTSRHEIRRRFHIDIAPAQGWDMDLPFEAVLSSTPTVPDRYQGEWERLGDRRSEGCLALPPSYFLWTWTNPTPDVAVDSIEIVPEHGRLLVAGITVGHADEYPFVRAGAVPMRVTVRGGDSTPDPLDLAISVDRGAASYTYPVTASLDDFLAPPVAGWGRVPDPAAGGYAHVAGTPSATVTIRSRGAELARVRWADLSDGSPVTEGPVELQLGDGGRNWVHVTVVDDATGRPVPCRVHFRSPDGVTYQPHGHHEYVSTALGSGGDVRLGGVTYAYIDGTCQGWLPRGQVVAEAARGFEYEPLREVLTVEPGTRELTLRLRRWV